MNECIDGGWDGGKEGWMDGQVDGLMCVKSMNGSRQRTKTAQCVGTDRSMIFSPSKEPAWPGTFSQ